MPRTFLEKVWGTGVKHHKGCNLVKRKWDQGFWGASSKALLCVLTCIVLCIRQTTTEVRKYLPPNTIIGRWRILSSGTETIRKQSKREGRK